MFQADRVHPVAGAQPKLLDNVWPALKPLLDASRDAEAAASPWERRAATSA